MKTITAYHFTGDTLRNGEPIPKLGRWLKHEGEIIACNSGLHASVHPYDALKFAPGPILHQVELRGEIVSHGTPVDKLVGRERKIIASVDATPILRRFAQLSALSVAHLWDAPDLVLEYLFTGDENLMAAAMAAAWAAAVAAARAAAVAAARAAARAAAMAAAWAAAWDASRAAYEKELRDIFAEFVSDAFN
jgi:hypothetical protein